MVDGDGRNGQRDGQRDFGGVIGDDWRTSTPWWPPEPVPPEGAPNVLLIVLDDVGFAQLGCYGSDIATPNIDALAARGVRMANFHTTALCSPTRACLMTGRNHHRNGMGRVADLASGFPGYWGRIPPENTFVSEALRAHGYATYAVGKWHLTPEDETNMAAPRSTWPVARGFDRWYGFHGGETHQFVPMLFHDNHMTRPPRAPDDGYHLSEDLADRAIEFVGDLRAVDAEQRFFLYFATGACHSPHHAPAEWIDRYRGQFDGGWDAWREETFARQRALGIVPEGTQLSPRPPWVPAWNDLPEREQRVAARFMECFAGFLSHADAQIGRVLSFLEETGDLDDTLVVLVSDNGASAEGGMLGSINDARIWNGIPAGRRELAERIDELGTPSAHNNYPWGWTMAGNTPFRRWKREVHEGGVADPCIVAWGDRLTGGAVRRQFAHAIDVMPTILETVGVPVPDGVDGTSFGYTFAAPDAADRHETQYFEMLGSRAIYHRGWKAVTFKPLGAMYDDGLDPDAPFEDDVWELYHVAEDLSETRNLAESEPARLRELVDLWWREARANDVLPLDNRPLAALLNPRPRRSAEREQYVYYPNGAVVPETVAVNVRNRDHSITASVAVPDGVVPNGVLIGLGSALGGWVLYVVDGELRYTHNLAGRERHRIVSDAGATRVGPGAHELAFRFEKTADFSGGGTLYVDGEAVGTGEVPFFTPVRFSITGAGLSVGYDLGPPIADDYRAPFPFNATLHRVVVDVSGDPHRDERAEFDAIMSEQ